MRAIPFLSALAVCFVAMATNSAMAAKKVALVIGNAGYQSVAPLANTTNDATAIGTKLRGLGFDVTSANDLDYRGLRQNLSEFRRKSQAADVSVVFYAGHGIEVDNRNYLIPVDASLKTDGDVEFEAIPLDLVLLSISGAKRFRMVILDACRDNPFAQTMQRQVATRSIGRGLARVEPVGETLVAFAAKEGTTAADGTGPHSPYTEALLAQLDQPGLEVGLLFRKVRDAVVASTSGQQEPFTYGSLSSREFYFNAPAGGPPVAGTPGTPSTDANVEEALWKAVEASATLEAYNSYLEQFPNGKYAFVAKIWIKSLTGGEREVDVASVPTPSEPDPVEPPGSAADLLIEKENPPILSCDRLAADPTDANRVALGVAWTEIKPKDAVEACRAAVRDYPVAKRLNYQLARALHRGGNYEEAKGIYETIGGSGYAAALDKLGVLYSQARGVSKDVNEALRLFREAADAGNADAHFHVGMMHHHGTGVRRDYAEARRRYETAAKAGHGSALVNLGILHTRGLGVRTSHTRALEYYRKAAEQDHPIALTNLGHMYRDGRAVRRDYGQALSYLKRGADKGASEAMYSLAVMYHQGQGTRRDYTESARQMYGAIARGNELALREMTTNARAWNQAFRRALQSEMSREGHYSGPIDGDFGAGTKRALTSLAKRDRA